MKRCFPQSRQWAQNQQSRGLRAEASETASHIHSSLPYAVYVVRFARAVLSVLHTEECPWPLKSCSQLCGVHASEGGPAEFNCI